MTRRLWVQSMALTLSLSLLGVPAASATTPQGAVPHFDSASPVEPAAKKELKVTWSKVYRKSQTRPYPRTVTYRLPVLHGSTKKYQKTLRQFAREVIDAQLDLFTEWREDCWDDGEEGTADFVGKASTYAGRYVSVAFTENFNIGCGGTLYFGSTVRTFTLDLKTGKKVSLSRFAAPKHPATKLAVMSALNRADSSCVYEGLTAWSGMPAVEYWTVSKKGVRFWFPGSAVGPKWCGVRSALVPWRELATAKERRGTKTSRVFVRDFSRVEGGGYWGQYKTLTVRGVDVGTHFSVIDSGEGRCVRGVRRGKKVTAYDFGVWNHGSESWMDHAKRVRFTLGGTKSKPTLPRGEGWRLATKAERKFIASNLGHKLDAFVLCDYSS